MAPESCSRVADLSHESKNESAEHASSDEVKIGLKQFKNIHHIIIYTINFCSIQYISNFGYSACCKGKHRMWLQINPRREWYSIATLKKQRSGRLSNRCNHQVFADKNLSLLFRSHTSTKTHWGGWDDNGKTAINGETKIPLT